MSNHEVQLIVFQQQRIAFHAQAVIFGVDKNADIFVERIGKNRQVGRKGLGMFVPTNFFGQGRSSKFVDK